MKHPTKPGQICRIIGSWSTDDQGKHGPNHGRKVVVLRLYVLQADGRVPVWRVRSLEGPLITSFGHITMELDCLNYWLEVIDEVSPKAVTTEKEEIVL